MPITISKNLAQQIVEAVKDICTYDINFINHKGIIFASTNPKRIGDFHEIGLKSIKSQQIIEVDSDHDYLGTQKGVNIPFTYKGDTVAVIGISGEPSHVRKYAYLAQKITMLLLRENELNTKFHLMKAQMNQIIRTLIYNEYTNPQFLKGFFDQYNTSLEDIYQTILVKIDSLYSPSNLSMIEKDIYQTFDATGSELYAFNYSNEYILFLRADKVKNQMYLFEELTKKHTPYLRIGIGRRVPLLKQHLSYQSAKIAADSLFPHEFVVSFEDLDISILLGNVTASAKDYYLEKTVSTLSEKDKKILRTYFSTNMSLKETCEQLYLHKNTLQYQLDKIHKNTGYNPRNFIEAVVLYIGLKILAKKEYGTDTSNLEPDKKDETI